MYLFLREMTYSKGNSVGCGVISWHSLIGSFCQYTRNFNEKDSTELAL